MNKRTATAVIAAICLGVAGCRPYSGGAAEHELSGYAGYDSYDVARDGHTLLLTGPGSGRVGRDLYLYDTLTKRTTRLTNTPEYKTCPAFSLDNKRIVYEAAADLNSNRYLYIRSLNGRSVRQLTSGEGVADSFPSFSRNGKKVVFARANVFYADRRGENTWDKYDVYSINVDGTGLRRLSHGNYSGIIRPRFTPDGRFVLFELWTDYPVKTAASIARIDTSGMGIPEQLTNEKNITMDTCPYIFPDGSKFVFVSNYGDLKLYTQALPSGAPIALHGDQMGGGGWQPIVTMDGKLIYFIGDGGTWVMQANGSDPHLVAGQNIFDKP